MEANRPGSRFYEALYSTCSTDSQVFSDSQGDTQIVAKKMFNLLDSWALMMLQPEEHPLFLYIFYQIFCWQCWPTVKNALKSVDLISLLLQDSSTMMKTCRICCQPFLSPHATRAQVLFWVMLFTHWILSAEIVKTFLGRRGSLSRQGN